MALEVPNYINDLVITNPTAVDPKSQGDDHIRYIKQVLKECFAGFTGAILLTATDTGTAAAHVLTPSTALIGYTTGLMLLYRPINAGTGALTVNVSALGAKSVKTLLGADPTSGDITANQPLLMMYDGTNFVIIAGSEMLMKTGNQTLTGNLAQTGDHTITGNASVSGNLTGPSMTAKANKAGETFTGAHDFTGATITVPTPTAAAQAVTKAYADGLAFATALPSQTGNAGKYVTTNGTTASWGVVNLQGDSTTTSSGSNITLTSASTRFQNVTMTSAGLQVNLPDATTLSKGGIVFAIKNAGTNVFTVKDTASAIIATVSPTQTVQLYLTTNAVSAGTWSLATDSGMALLSTVVAAGAATADIETTFDATYDYYILSAVGIDLATTAQDLLIQFKIAGTYQTSGYSTVSERTSSATFTASNTGTTGINVTNGSGYDNSQSSIALTLTIKNPMSTTRHKTVSYTGELNINGGAPAMLRGAGTYSSSASGTLTGIRFKASSGNISGTFRLYGVRNT